MNNDELDLVEHQHPLYDIIMTKVLEDCFENQTSEQIPNNKEDIYNWLLSLAN